jgi:translation initiation factor IF-3
MRRRWQKAKPQKEEKFFKANNQIKTDEVFLIDESGENVGVMSLQDALARAEESGLDLVEVNPKGNPPVVKVLDLGQLKYEREKKLHKQKVAQKKVEIKNVRLSIRISKGDFDIRVAQAVKFLTKGNKLKVDLVLRGRERQHLEKARETIQEFINALKGESSLKVEEEQPLTKQPSGFTMILINRK